MTHMSMNLKELISAAIEVKLRGDFQSARDQIEVALVEARRIKDRWGEAQCLLELGGIDIHFNGDYENGEKRFEESLSLYTSLRSDQGQAYAMNGLAHVARAQNDIGKARASLSRSLALFEEAHDRNGQAAALHEMALLDEKAGDSSSAEAYLRRCPLILESLGNKSGIGQTLLNRWC
jgi:tetratricopeptide (TPR) repeat protein